jgi:ATP-dependent Clp protease ATP-binding subunit ClpC
VVVFSPLDRSQLLEVGQLLVGDVVAHLARRGTALEVPGDVIAWLLERAGADPGSGARPLRRAVQRFLEDAVSDCLIRRHGAQAVELVARVEGERVLVEAREGALT